MMSKPLFLALEQQLEIEKLQDLETQANKTGESEILFDNLKKQKDVQEEADSVQDDASPEETVDDQTPEPAIESLRNLTISYEDYNNEYWNQQDTPKTIGSRFLDAIKAIGSLGVQYGPSIIKSVYKGVLYAFGALTNLLIASTDTLTEYLERRINSFNNLKSSIASLRKTVDLLEDSDSLIGQTFNDQKLINSLKIGDSVDFVANVKTLRFAINNIFNSLEARINNDVSLVKHLISLSNFGISNGFTPNLEVKPLSSSFRHESLDGFQPDNQFTQTFIYSERLPSDVIVISYIPAISLQSVQETTVAYNQSKLFLGFDVNNFKSIENIDYMTPQQLKQFLKELEALCELCIRQQKLYADLLVTKKNFKFGFKSYFKRISEANRKITVKESLVEVVQLKTLLIDKVYLSGAMDMHDYCAKTIVLSLSIVKEHVKRLS